MATRVKHRSSNTKAGPRDVKRRQLQLRTASAAPHKRVVSDVVLSSDTDNEVDEQLDMDDEMQHNAAHNTSDTDNEYEDADYARLRMAKQYLHAVRQRVVEEGAAGAVDADDRDEDVDVGVDHRHGITASEQYINAKINQKLQSDQSIIDRRHTSLLAAGLHRDLIGTPPCRHTFKRHSKPVTCCAVSDKYLVSASLDGTVSYYDLHSTQRLHTFRRGMHTGDLGHRSAVLTCDISNNSNYIATAGVDHNIHLWDTRSNTLAQKLVAVHRDRITALRFSPDNTELYSASYDRTVKVYNCAINADLDENEAVLNYLDTLYGHTAHVTSLSTLQSTHVLSGGTDKSLRMFNKDKQTQLLYKGSQAAIDCVSMFNDHTYITGNQAGQVQLWNSNKKKPLHTIDNAHDTQVQQQHNGAYTMTNNTQCNWITAIAALPFTDLAFSGSSNNTVNVYQLATNQRSIQRINTIHVNGIVNDIRFSTDGKYVAVAVGREYRLGRWFTTAPGSVARNQVHLYSLAALRTPAAEQHTLNGSTQQIDET